MSDRSGPTLVACDLDRTLIYSPKAFWLEAHESRIAADNAPNLDAEDAAAPRMIVAEIHRGIPISFMTRTAETLLVRLAGLASFVPVTTRTVSQYRRVQLPAPVPHWAITSNGGVLLRDGVPDAQWSARVRSRLDSEAAPLPDVRALLAGTPATPPWITKINTAEALFVYAIVDRTTMPGSWLGDLEAQSASLGWTVSVQGRKLYCVPDALTKSSAVAEVRDRLEATTVLAAGDSLLDAPMLERADLAFRPAHGELHDAGFDRPNLTVTTSRGILAGEELLRLLTAALPRTAPGEVPA